MARITLPEGVTLGWVLRRLDIIRSYARDGHTYSDVVAAIDVRIRVMNQYSRGAALDQTIFLDLTTLDPELYTQWQDISKEDAHSWIESVLGVETCTLLETRALKLLTDPDYQYSTLPNWVVQDPADMKL